MQIRPALSASGARPIRTLQAAPGAVPQDVFRPGGPQESDPALVRPPASGPARGASQPRAGSPRHEEASTAEGLALASRMVSGWNLPSSLKVGAARDLACLPLAWLQRLDSEGLTVAVLQDGQSLADTDVLPTMTPERCRKHFAQAQALARTAIDEENRALSLDPEAPADDFASAMARRWLPDRIRENLLPKLDQAGIGFSVEVCREAVDLKALARSKQIPDEEFQTWRDLLVELNGPLLTVSGDRGQAAQEILMVPYASHRGRPVSEVSRDNYATFDSMKVRQHRGIHSWPNRLIMVHEAFVKEPADEVGNYRVLVHELGHAMDYLAEGFLPEHRSTVDALFAADLEAARQGEARFLTPRSADNPREYLAEAVEAYMTRRVGDEHDFYKPENSREDLQQRNPALFEYVRSLFEGSAT